MNTNIMALTATAPKTLRIQLSKLFGMKDPVSIILPPCKENIFYRLSSFVSLEENFSEMLDCIRKERDFFQELSSIAGLWKTAQISIFFFREN